MTLRAIAFMPHPPAGASSRYRVHQMVPGLARLGISVEVHPFFDERGFAVLYHKGRVAEKAAHVARSTARRWRDLLRARSFDVALVHRELWPLTGDAMIERLRRHQPRWLYDFDDAVFLPNVSAANRAFGVLKSHGQARRLAACATIVSAGNPWLADWARAQRPGADAASVGVVPTAVDTERWRPRPRDPGPPRLVWIGSHSTVSYLEPLRPVLPELARRHPGLELHVIGARFEAEGIRTVTHPWTLESEVELTASCDVGLAPLADTHWARGKCGLKLLLYMALGLPSVASPVGVHPEIVEDGVNAHLASTPEEFARVLDALLADPATRARLGAAARETVEARYSIHAVLPRLAALLRCAAES